MAPAYETFHELIAKNKRRSMVLMALMAIFLLGLGAVFGGAYRDVTGGLLIAAVVTGIMLLFAWFSGSETLLAFSGAQEIEKKDAPQLYNIVEEMAIAAGVPMPRVFLIDSACPNAFATGNDPAHAAVAITTGLLDKLDRDEAQGVIAHEIGHIRNYDIRFSMLMAIMAGGVILLSDLFLRTTLLTGGRRRSNDREGGGLQAILMVVGIVLAILSPLLTALIQMAMSREREYLADASAVEFTRNPNGLANALRKLGADQTPMEVSGATENMYIVSPKLAMRGGADSLFSTHPPIAERIARLKRLVHN